ncbi:MAG: hypothetical protein ACLQME_12555 [Alphaproteobacteria bacterium]
MSFAIADYRALRARMAEHYSDEITKADVRRAPANESEFARAVVSVMVGAEPPTMGASAQALEGAERVTKLIREHRRAVQMAGVESTSSLSRALLDVWQSRDRAFDEYRLLETDDARLAFLGRLPFVDEAAAWRIATHFGIPDTRPGKHLTVIAAVLGETPQDFCAQLARESGDSPAVVDAVLWRALERGWLDMATLRMRPRGTAIGARLFRSARSEADIYGTDSELEEAAGVSSVEG